MSDGARPGAANARQDRSGCAVRMRIIDVSSSGIRTLSASAILREFDLLRRDIAVEVAGYEGVSAGYDELEWYMSAPPAEEFCVVAQVEEVHARGWHRVGYTCSALLRSFRGRGHALEVVVARAVGTTLVPVPGD